MVGSQQIQGPQRLLLNAAREAEQVLEEQAQEHPTYADIRHRLGLLRLSRGAYEAAQAEFEEALGIHPGYRAAHYALRLTQALRGTPPPETGAPRTEVRHSPEEALWERVDAAYRRGLTGEEPMSSFPRGDGEEQLLYHHYAAAFAARRGERAAMRAAWEEAGKIDPAAARILGEIGLLPWSPSSEALALALGQELLWSPLAADLYEYLGRIYARNGLQEEALACYRRAYLVLPRAARQGRYQAELAIAAGAEEEAVDLLTEAIEADPTDVEARIALAFEYAAQGYAQEARVQFEVAAKLAPGYADVRYNLGLLYLGERRPEEALQQFRCALEINPAYLPARLSIASHLARTQRHAEGLREYERVLRQGFQSADMLVQMGRAALALGSSEEALQYLERACFINPDYPPAHYYLGQAYKRKGLRRKARSAWRRYLERANECEPHAGSDLAEELEA